MRLREIVKPKRITTNLQAFTGVQLATRAAVGAGVTLSIAQFLRLDFPIYAALAAIIATDLTPAQSRQLGLRRLVATVIGAFCGVSLTLILAPGAWSVGLSVLAAMLICELLRAREASKVAAYICSIIVLHHTADPWLFAFHRSIETVLGIAVAWALSYVPKLIQVRSEELGGA